MHPIWAAHPRTHLSTEYPPPGRPHTHFRTKKAILQKPKVEIYQNLKK